MDLTRIPSPDLYRQINSRRGKLGGRPAKVTTCTKCGNPVTARQARRRCPHTLLGR